MQQQLRLFDIGQKGNNLRQIGHVMVIAIRHQSKADPSHYSATLARPFRHHPPLLRKQFLNRSTISIFHPQHRSQSKDSSSSLKIKISPFESPLSQ